MHERREVYRQGWRCKAAQLWSCHGCCMGEAAQAAGSSWDLSPSTHPHLTPLPGPAQRQTVHLQGSTPSPSGTWRAQHTHFYPAFPEKVVWCQNKKVMGVTVLFKVTLQRHMPAVIRLLTWQMLPLLTKSPLPYHLVEAGLNGKKFSLCSNKTKKKDDGAEEDLFSFAEFLHVVWEMFHAVFRQLEMNSFLEFTNRGKLKTGQCFTGVTNIFFLWKEIYFKLWLFILFFCWKRCNDDNPTTAGFRGNTPNHNTIRRQVYNYWLEAKIKWWWIIWPHIKLCEWISWRANVC